MIEVVYMRHHKTYREEFDTIEQALGFIEYGEDTGTLSSIGVFVDGEPSIYDGYVTQDPPTIPQQQEMRDSYQRATT